MASNGEARGRPSLRAAAVPRLRQRLGRGAGPQLHRIDCRGDAAVCRRECTTAFISLPVAATVPRTGFLSAFRSLTKLKNVLIAGSGGPGGGGDRAWPSAAAAGWPCGAQSDTAHEPVGGRTVRQPELKVSTSAHTNT